MSRLIEQSRVDTVVAHAPSREQLTDWRNGHPATTFVVIAGESDGGGTLDALYAGASAILPPWSKSTEIVTAIDLARRGLTLLPRARARGSLLIFDHPPAVAPSPGQAFQGERAMIRLAGCQEH